MADQLMDRSTARVMSLGGVLRAERDRRGLAIEQVAKFAGMSVATVRSVECDDHELSPDQLDQLMHHYLVPDWSTQRGLGELTLDLDQGIVSFSDRGSSRVIDDPADRVLARYVSLLYTQRGVAVGTKVPVKDIDLTILRSALSVRQPEVRQHLESMQAVQEAKTATVERRARFVVGGLTVVAVALGLAIVLTGSEAEPAIVVPTESVVPAGVEVTVPAGVEITVEIGEAVSITRPPAAVPAD